MKIFVSNTLNVDEKEQLISIGVNDEFFIHGEFCENADPHPEFINSKTLPESLQRLEDIPLNVIKSLVSSYLLVITSILDKMLETLGLEMGDPTAIATLDAMAAGSVLPGMPTAGYTCTQYGGAIEGACIAEVAYGNDMYVINPDIGATWSFFLTMNSASVQQYLAAGYTLEQLAAGFPE